MPGIVVFNRRWGVGSDDFIIPAAILAALHTVWIIVLSVILSLEEVDANDSCGAVMKGHMIVFLVLLCVSVVIEALVAWLSLQGTILNSEPRSRIHYLIYVRLGVFVGEIVWQVVGVVWLAQHYATCTHLPAKYAILGVVVCNWVVIVCMFLSIWCTFDAAGHSWVKLMNYQDSLKGQGAHLHQKYYLGNGHRNWRHRKATRKYERSWDKRCGILFCCIRDEERQHSFTEVAQLLAEFFRDLDVVPSDIVAGLVLLRRHQQFRKRLTTSQENNDVYQFLSGVPITPSTRFVNLQEPETRTAYEKVVHYMRYALAAYGWPVYMMMNTGSGLCRIMPQLRCTCCCCYFCCKPKQQRSNVVDDNCCQCNFAALQKLTGLRELDLVYATYHDDIGETPFFIAIDHEQRTIIISIRGTLSLKDVVTDLKADAEVLPVEPVREDWLAHKGMVQAADYIKKKIKDEELLVNAFSRDMERGTQNYGVVVVGHSLGAGTAAILAIMMKQEYPSLQCYAYSPPGGLLSMTCVEETKSFITAVIVGKDFIPRIGLHQLEVLRQELIDVIKKSEDPKWKIILNSMLCCHKDLPEDLQCTIEMSELTKQVKESRNFFHPSDTQISLSVHVPLFPPGKILHIVRKHKKNSSCWKCSHEESIFEAIWADNAAFDEVLISPVMAADHLPDKVLDALEKVMSSPSVIRSVPCHSREASLEITSSVNAANDHSALFVVGSESQIAPHDTATHSLTNPTSVLKSVLGGVQGTPTHPALSLPVRCDRGHPSMVHRSRPLASPDTLYGSSPLPVLHSAGSFSSTEDSPKSAQLTGIRRCSSLPSSRDTRSLENRGFLKSSPLDRNDTARLMTSLQNRINSVHNNCHVSTSSYVKTELNNGDITTDSQSSTAPANNLTFVGHSPDSPSHQLLYDDYLGHYSLAGRGYPHGFGHCLEHSALPKYRAKVAVPTIAPLKSGFCVGRLEETGFSFDPSVVGFDDHSDNTDAEYGFSSA